MENLENGSALYSVAFVLFLVGTLTVNVLLLLLFIRNPVLITPMNLLLVNLGVANISLALLSLSFSLVTALTSQWIFPELIRQVAGLSGTFLSLASLFTSFSLASERFFVLSNHRRYRDLYTTRSVGCRILASWVLAGVVAAVPIGVGGYVFDSQTAVCVAADPTARLLPTAANFVYLILWLYTVLNILTLPSVAAPEPLRAKQQGNTGRYLGALLVGGVYSLHATLDVAVVVVERLRAMPEDGTAHLLTGRTRVMTGYSVLVLMPLLAILADSQLRRACKEVCRRGGSGGEPREPLYEYERVYPAQTCHQNQQQQTSFTKVPMQLEYPFIHPSTLPPGMIGVPRPVSRQITALKGGTLPVRPCPSRGGGHGYPVRGGRLLVRSQSLNRPPTVVEAQCQQQQRSDGTGSSSSSSGTVRNGKSSSTTSSSTVGEIVDL